jgi:hypothetical protein
MIASIWLYLAQTNSMRFLVKYKKGLHTAMASRLHALCAYISFFLSFFFIFYYFRLLITCSFSYFYFTYLLILAIMTYFASDLDEQFRRACQCDDEQVDDNGSKTARGKLCESGCTHVIADGPFRRRAYPHVLM